MYVKRPHENDEIKNQRILVYTACKCLESGATQQTAVTSGEAKGTRIFIKQDQTKSNIVIAWKDFT